MKVFVKERVRAGSKCQEFRDDRQVQNPTNVIDQPDGRFHTIHLHCIGPIVDSNGYQHTLTVIDRFTGYLVIHPLKSLTFVDTFYAIQSAWIKYYGYLALAKRVWLHVEPETRLNAPHQGPFDVIARHEDYYTIDVNGKQKKYNVDRLKPHYELNHVIFGGESAGTTDLKRHNRRALRRQPLHELLVDYDPDDLV